MLITVGCSINNSTVEYLSAANSRLISAQENGAEQLAAPEFEEARSLYAEAELALQRKDKEALPIAQRAFAKARLAEALARQTKAETEAEESEKSLKKASDEAKRAHEERIAAENELSRTPSD